MSMTIIIASEYLRTLTQEQEDTKDKSALIMDFLHDEMWWLANLSAALVVQSIDEMKPVIDHGTTA